MLLVSCSNETKLRLPAVELTPDQIGKYQTSCAGCHENEAMGAPLKGKKEAWANVFAKPFEEVMYRVINGYRGMPPLGQCFSFLTKIFLKLAKNSSLKLSRNFWLNVIRGSINTSETLSK